MNLQFFYNYTESMSQDSQLIKFQASSTHTHKVTEGKCDYHYLPFHLNKWLSQSGPLLDHETTSKHQSHFLSYLCSVITFLSLHFLSFSWQEVGTIQSWKTKENSTTLSWDIYIYITGWATHLWSVYVNLLACFLLFIYSYLFL